MFQPFLLKEHLNRLFASAQTIDLELPKSLSGIEKLVLKTLKKNHSKKEKAIRIIVTGGHSLPPAFTQVKGKSTLIITVDPKHQYPLAHYEHGVKVITYKHARQTPEAKTLNYLAAIKAQKQARRQGAIEAIYLSKGKITESTTSNFFAVIDNRRIGRGKIVTPGPITQKLMAKFKDFINKKSP